MKLIIDGYNLMHKLDLRGGTLEQKRREIAGLLEGFLEENPAKITLVFDGGRSGSLQRGSERMGKIQVYYSAEGETADEVIMEMVTKREGRAREICVVSSDNRITSFAAQHSCRTMTSDDFAEYL